MLLMAQDIASSRMTRVNKLLRTMLGHKEITKDELMKLVPYVSVRMLQRDIAYLKSEHGVHITYNFSHQTYQCRVAGDFALYFKFEEDEEAFLCAAIEHYARTMPDTEQTAKRVRDKLSVFFKQSGEKHKK